MIFFKTKNHLLILLLGSLFNAFQTLQAQDTLRVVAADKTLPVTTTKNKVKKFLPLKIKDFLQSYEKKVDSLIYHHRDYNSHLVIPDLLTNPYYYALMGGSTLYSTALHNKMGFAEVNLAQTKFTSGLISSHHIYEIINHTDNQLIHVYAETPWLIRYEEEKEGLLNVDQEIKEGVKPETTLTEHFGHDLNAQNLDILMGDDLGIVVRKPNFWTFKTNFSFQFTQNYVSDNWYKGGESHNSMLAAAIIDANFDNKQKLTFDNRLEMKLGFQTSHDDLKHKFKTNSDLLRLTNKLGINAIKDWYYTLMLQSWTQFCKGYKPNDPKVYSDFMAPFVSLLSVGMDYKKHSKNNKFNITATVSPLALKFQYVERPELVKSFGHDDGHKVKWEYGSNITINYKWDFLKNISWAGRFYFFSDYSKSQIEWENTFNFTINRYLSTRLFLYPRFDDAIARKGDHSYFQFNELLSLGLNFNL